MKPTLVVLAAGMGSRYGGLKQVDPVGPSGEAILAKENIIVEMGKLRSKLAQLCAACRLCYLLLCHNV